jgi:hypothetical protein
MRQANVRSALDARTARCFHIGCHWPGAGESDVTLLFHQLSTTPLRSDIRSQRTDDRFQRSEN